MPSPESDALAAAGLQELAQIAVAAVHRGLRGAAAQDDPLRMASAALRATGASFVTLKQHGMLRGCIGSLERRRALAEDVAANAFAAAFRDPRFPPLCEPELTATRLDVSILSPPVMVAFASADELYAMLRPGIDGLVVEHGGHHATYLPAVWEKLPDPRQFVIELRHKARIAKSVPMTALAVRRYTTQHAGPVPLR